MRTIEERVDSFIYTSVDDLRNTLKLTTADELESLYRARDLAKRGHQVTKFKLLAAAIRRLEKAASTSSTPSTPSTEVYGYGVLCAFRGADGTEEIRLLRSKGPSETKARRAHIFKRGFERVIELDPYTREQWLRTFGEGRV